jgi:tRNA(Ile)-lysidine synthase
MSHDPTLPNRVLAHIRSARLFREPGEALVAVSGGADSVALLDLLNGMAAELGLRLVVAHVDHGIASDSRTVAQSVKNLAATYGVPFEAGELRLGADATETEARRALCMGLAGIRSAGVVVESHPCYFRE